MFSSKLFSSAHIFISMQVSLFELVWRKHTSPKKCIYEVSVKNWRHQSDGISCDAHVDRLGEAREEKKKKNVKISAALYLLLLLLLLLAAAVAAVVACVDIRGTKFG